MSERLSSDILEGQFGPTEMEVLRQEDMTRLIRTTAIADGRTLELSRVIFKTSDGAGFPEVHREVMAGKSMGKAFRDRGMEFHRQIHAVCRLGPEDLPAGFRERFGAPGPATVVEVSALAGPAATPYADILEVYSPAVTWPHAGESADAALIGRLQAFARLLPDPRR